MKFGIVMYVPHLGPQKRVREYADQICRSLQSRGCEVKITSSIGSALRLIASSTRAGLLYIAKEPWDDTSSGHCRQAQLIATANPGLTCVWWSVGDQPKEDTMRIL